MDADFLPFIAHCIDGDEPSWKAFFPEYGTHANQILEKRFQTYTLHEIDDILQNFFDMPVWWRAKGRSRQDPRFSISRNIAALVKRISSEATTIFLKQVERRDRGVRQRLETGVSELHISQV